jgi:sugar transferase (PEP-CTERM/EpsH1 system associated)
LSLRILIVTPSLPYPPSWGFGIRVYQIIRNLSVRHRVSVLAYASPHDGERVAALRETGATVHTVVRDEPSATAKRFMQLRSIVSPESFQRQRLSSMAMQQTIDRLLAAEAYDIIQVESSQMCGVEFKSRAPLVVDEHNIEYELLYRTYCTERSRLRKLYNWVEYRKSRRDEHRTWNKVAGCVLTSDREMAILRRYAPHIPAVVVPNGVDVEYFQPDTVAEDPNSIVFVGVMHYRPNSDAAVYFIREILPHIRRERPDTTFTVVGGGAPDELRSLAGQHVILTDTVPDTRPYVSRAAAFVVPLRMGSGTRLKVLEGLSMRRALVSTSLGCEGIAAVDGQHLLVADDPLAFARHVLRVLSDRELASRLGQDGRKLVEQEYSWPSIVGGLEDFLLSLRSPTTVDAPRLAG